MNDKQEIQFWLKAKKLIREGYGKPCKDFNWNCPVCKANLVVAWIDDQLDLLELFSKMAKNKKNTFKKNS